MWDAGLAHTSWQFGLLNDPWLSVQYLGTGRLEDIAWGSANWSFQPSVGYLLAAIVLVACVLHEAIRKSENLASPRTSADLQR